MIHSGTNMIPTGANVASTIQRLGQDVQWLSFGSLQNKDDKTFCDSHDPPFLRGGPRKIDWNALEADVNKLHTEHEAPQGENYFSHANVTKRVNKYCPSYHKCLDSSG